MANIYSRNGTWYARATYNGDEFRETLETTSRAVAQERLQEWLKRLKACNWGERPRRTFAETRDKFTSEHMPRLKRSSQTRYVVSLLNLSVHLEGKHLDEIGSAVLSEFEDARRKEGVTNGTIRRDLACLSSLFSSAEEWEFCQGNPAAAYLRSRRKRGLKEAPPRSRYLSQEEEQDFLVWIAAKIKSSTARDKHAYTMFEAAFAMAIDVGLRKEEQLALTWREVDLERREIMVPNERAKGGIGRWVPILPRTEALLRALPRHKDSVYVFWTREGQRYFDLYQQLARVAVRVGVRDLRWHDLRRTCGCRLIQDWQMPMERVKLWLGHSSVLVTEKVYAFLDVRHLHKSVGTVSHIASLAPAQPAEAIPLKPVPKHIRAQTAKTTVEAFVYIIASEDLVKIGVSENPEARVRAMQISNAQALRVKFAHKAERKAAFAIERAAHTALAHCSTSGEWFRCEVDVARMVVEGIISGMVAAQNSAQSKSSMAHLDLNPRQSPLKKKTISKKSETIE